MLEFNVLKYYFEHNEGRVPFFVKTEYIDYYNLHVLMFVEASQNSSPKYLTITNRTL